MADKSLTIKTEYIQCSCTSPLWGYCEDDLFCPLCGDPVAQLKTTQASLSQPTALVGDESSGHLKPSREGHDSQSRLLIYDQKGMGFAFSMSLEFAGQDRSIRSRTPRIDVDKTSLMGQTWFLPRLHVPPARPGNKLFCSLVPRPGLETPNLSDRGLESEITLEGDFGRVDFPVLICNAPDIVAELTGPGIESDKDRTWKVWKDEQLTLDLTLRATTAPIIIDKDIDEILVMDKDAVARNVPPVTAKLVNKLRKGTRLLPEGEEGEPEVTWSSTLLLDCSSFGEKDRNCKLALNVRLLGVESYPTVLLPLTYVDSGRLDFSPSTLTIELAYVGEVRSNAALENPEPKPIVPKWYITNIGQQDITVRIAKPNPNPNPDHAAARTQWLTVQWAAPEDTDVESVQPGRNGTVTLSRGQQAQLYVRIDLTVLDRTTFQNGSALDEKVVLQDERGEPFKADIRLERVIFRSPADAPPLAIDFGNTHSFAAMWNPGDMPIQFRRQDIIPAHELRRPDVFPTAIYFESVADRDNPVYFIGFEALERAAENPLGLVTDLKRWIGKDDKQHFRIVKDRSGNRPEPNYDIETLVLLYLRALVRQSENVIRKFDIREVGISYPSKFGPERRRAFDAILDRLAQGSPDLPPVTLVTGGAAIDEANAAVISYVFSKEFQERHQDLLDRGNFTIAAVDWGGGSLDTAVLEFTVEGQWGNPAFSSHYLAIGGDEFFGGDNMTISVMELILDTLRQILTDVVPEEAWERLVHAPADQGDESLVQRPNFNALWITAELIKQFQSNFWKKTPGNADLATLRQALRKQLVDNFTYFLSGATTTRKDRRPEGERQAAACAIVEAAINADQFLIDLDDAWKRPIEADFEDDSGYSIEGRFRQILKKSIVAVTRREPPTEVRTLDVLVLCGSASRLPLVEILVREVCPDAVIVNAPGDAKRRVAYGIVRYLHAYHGAHELARSSDYTNAEFGLLQLGYNKFIPVIPACSHVMQPETRYPFLIRNRNQEQPIELGGFIIQDKSTKKSRLDLYREGPQPQRPCGYFDLSTPPVGSDQRPNALDSGLPIKGHLRLKGSETHIELYLEIDSVEYGPWPLVPWK